jgi:RNA-binding protein 23/39
MKEVESALSKDQRTVFISQLVMRTTEKDVRRYFNKKVGCKVNEIILLRDRKSRTHKGCGYVQFARIEDVVKAIAVSGIPPDFQRFPILVKESEAERNYVVPLSSSVVTPSMLGTTTTQVITPFIDKNGKQVESQKVYVGGLDPTVTDEHLLAIFSQFGQLDKVNMQIDPATNISRGYAFLSYRDPKDANLAIQTMAGQVIAGRPMKTGWANQASSIPNVPIVTSDELPDDAGVRVQKAIQVFGQLVGGSSEAVINAMTLSATAEQAIDAALGMTDVPKKAHLMENNQNQVASHGPSAIPTVAEARATLQAAVNRTTSAAAVAAVSAALATAPTPNLIGRADNPSRQILVYNMFDRDQETDPGWEKDIEEDFLEEASKFGKIENVVVMHTEPGGKIYASFEEVEAAQSCAKNLAGRWFDKRQLRVDFVDEMDLQTQKELSP